MYKGVIIKSSLRDPKILDRFRILGHTMSPNSGWDMYTVEATREQLEDLSHELDGGKWYAHFWQGRDVVVVYKDKTFELNFNDKASWRPAVDYGISIGIPKEQLDFPID